MDAAGRQAGKITPLEHAVYAIAWLSILAVFCAAAWIHPDPSGLGSHTQLHLPPCGFYEVFHKPCPSCGMTTAFAWMMHLHPVEAFHAQPAGAAVFLSALFLFLYLPCAWARRKPPLTIIEAPVFMVATSGLIALILVVWVSRVL